MMYVLSKMDIYGNFKLVRVASSPSTLLEWFKKQGFDIIRISDDLCWYADAEYNNEEYHFWCSEVEKI